MVHCGEYSAMVLNEILSMNVFKNYVLLRKEAKDNGKKDAMVNY